MLNLKTNIEPLTQQDITQLDQWSANNNQTLFTLSILLGIVFLLSVAARYYYFYSNTLTLVSIVSLLGMGALLSSRYFYDPTQATRQENKKQVFVGVIKDKNIEKIYNNKDKKYNIEHQLIFENDILPIGEAEYPKYQKGQTLQLNMFIDQKIIFSKEILEK
ncbi:MAG: hypothetical protein EAZ55_09165 [Cytophagales bacterium]|nr:MAG: hypothetical protein EAZ55_09165 [Cytophagales bacterium]